MNDQLPIYRYTDVDEIFGGFLTAPAAKLIPVEDAKLANKVQVTDNLMNEIIDRLPDPKPMPTIG
jgi:hypothetical protein